MKKISLIFASAFLFSASALAAPPKPGMNVFFAAGLKGSYGNMETVDGVTIASRSFGVYGLDTDLGVSFGGFKIGGALDYSWWLQMKDPAELGNSNTQGKVLSFGPMVGYNFGSFELQGRYFLKSNYSLDRSTTSGLSVAYLEPESAFALQARIPFGNGTPFLGLEYKSITYTKGEVGTQTVTYAEAAKVKTSAFGLIVGLSY